MSNHSHNHNHNHNHNHDSNYDYNYNWDYGENFNFSGNYSDYYSDDFYARPETPYNNLEVGIIHFFLSLTFMILQILVFSSFFNKRELFRRTCFKIMFHHGIVSFIQQVCHTLASFFTMLCINNKSTVFTIIGSLLTASYMGSILFIFLLTLNRFDIIYSIQILYEPSKQIFYLIGIILCYLWTLILFVIYFIVPEYRKYFSYTYYEWIYVDYSASKIIFEFEKYSVLSFLGISMVLYFLILIKIFALRCNTSKKAIFVADDFKIIFHAFLCFVSALFLELIWDGWFVEIYWSETLVMFPHILFIFCSVSNSLFVFCFVKDIRINMAFYKFFKGNGNVVISNGSVKTIHKVNVVRSVT